MKNDFLVFVSLNSDIKILNTRNGKYIGDIDGAHFKGTYNFGLIVSNGLKGRLKDLMASFEESKSEKKFMDVAIEQLNHFLMISCSIKDKLKVWKFEDGLASPISQASCIGGSLDQPITVLNTVGKELCLLVMGSASNKAEIFKLKQG